MKRYLLLAFALAASPATAAVQFGGGSLSVSTYGYLGDPSQPRFTSAFSNSAIPRDLAASTALSVARPGTGDTLDLSYRAGADVRSPSRIMLTATSGITFDIATPGFVPAYGQTGSNFNYNFILDRRTSVTIDYAISKAVNPVPSFGIGGDPARLIIIGPGGFPPLAEFAAGPNSTGRFTATLASGQYNLGLLTILNGSPATPLVAAASGRTVFAGTDLFDINFGGVPEPASWALMISGFGLVGLSMRARNRATRRAPLPFE